VLRRSTGRAIQGRARARLALIRATEEVLARRPDLTVAFVRSRLERAAGRRDGEPLDSRVVLARLTIRVIDVHPVVGERLVRLWLRRARQQALEEAGIDRV
jgi:hypothetical protein